MNLPTLSVVTPSFNGAEFLEDCLLSVARQQGSSFQHIVMDCVSTDNSSQILKRFPQVQWTSEMDTGQSDAINKGFLHATGDLVGWLNSDDYYLPGGLRAIAEAAQQHPEADVIYGDCVFVNSVGKIVRSKVEHDFDPAILLYFGCHIPSTSTFIRKRVIDSGFLLKCDYRVCMDFEYFARLAHAGYKFHYVPRLIAAFRWHGCNVSLKQADRRRQERLQVQRSFGRHPYSLAMLKVLTHVYRAKRWLRKVVSGNIARELRLRRMLGRDTRWQEGAPGSETCASLACL